jgi:hypothetical protein
MFAVLSDAVPGDLDVDDVRSLSGIKKNVPNQGVDAGN